MFGFGRDDLSCHAARVNRFKVANYRIEGFRHNPYIGSFHGVPYVNEPDISTSEQLTLANAKKNPMIGIFRHSPSVCSDRKGLKAAIYSEKSNIPVVSRLHVTSPAVAFQHNFVSSLKQIPLSVYSAKPSPAHSICDSEVDADGSKIRDHCDKPMCSICLDEYRDGDELLTLACGHCFHSECVNKWFFQGCLNNAALNETFRCPHCRQDHLALTSEKGSNCSEDNGIPTSSFLKIGQSLLADGGYDFLSDISSEHRSQIESTKVEKVCDRQTLTDECVQSPSKDLAIVAPLELSGYSDCGVPL